ncbi:hypothetical protein QAD02_005213 [Eretmocerus hayati]|uniref:Uncharacterized protein n=1 Tax=Eretmocerus hayati TaxID=131215 RepID=A0ACC2NSW4_9HYME|nr:hypothetical protein QAD02_005213 [Eretmocerus hayati]
MQKILIVSETNKVPRPKRSFFGEVVSENDYPFVVALHNQYHQYICAGSIITRLLVLTASHCVDGNNLYHVRIPSYDGQIEYQYDIEKTIAYPQIDGIYYNDIALLILKLPILNARIITLFPKEWKVPPGAIATAFGWGMMEDGTMPKNLRKVYLPIISAPRCNGNYVYEYHWICTDSRHRDICSGDSGGPLIWKNYLVGIASSVSKAGCRSGDPSTFAEVSAYRDWIDSYIVLYQ